MKIIDLLNKIANGEEVPNKIYCFNKEFYLKGNTYFGDTFTLMHYIQEEDLNDEVEILEEEPRDIEVCGSLFTKSEYDKLAHSEEEKKIPEKIPYQFSLNYIYCNINETAKEEIDKTINHIYDKINEIIDKINKLEEK